MDGRGRARRRLPEEAVEKQNTPSSSMCVTAFPEMSRQPIKCDKLKTGSTIIRQKQTHAEPMSETVKQLFFQAEKNWLRQHLLRGHKCELIFAALHIL